MLILLMDYTTFFLFFPQVFRLQRQTWCLLSSATRRFHSSSVISAPTSADSSAVAVLSGQITKQSKGAVEGYRALVLMCVLSKEQRVTCRTNSTNMLLFELTSTGHGSADPVSTCTNTAVTLYLGLCSVFICLILQGTFCKKSHDRLLNQNHR